MEQDSYGQIDISILVEVGPIRTLLNVFHFDTLKYKL